MAWMAERVAQDRVNLGCFWSLAIGWAVVWWLWSFLPHRLSYSPLFDEIGIAALFLGAIYFTIDRWRFADATLIVDAPPAPGHTFRGKVETPLKSEPSGMRLRVRATHYVRKPGTTTIWSTTVDAHPMRGERGIVVPVEVSIPADVPNQELSLDWDLTVRAGLYRAKFVVARASR